MQVIEFLRDAQLPREARAVCVGAFDGFHLGHQYLLRNLCAAAAERGLPSCVLTFEPIPVQYFAGPSVPPMRLTTHQERRELVASICCDLLAFMRFDDDLARMDAETFCRVVLVELLGTTVLVASESHTLGSDRGDVARIEQIGAALGFEVLRLPLLRTGELRVSSTAIRDFLREGHVEEPAALLGRRYSLRGKVVPGRGKGKQLGFPTANLAVAPEKLLPADAVYAGLATVTRPGGGDRRRICPAAISIGDAPTYGLGQRAVEAHLVSQDPLELLGRELKLEFLRRLRWQQKFDSEEELGRQIAADVRETVRVSEPVLSGPAAVEA